MFIDLTKEKFGRLTVIERAENAKSGAVRWKCRCDCGKTVTVQRSNLKSGGTKSCGCLQKEISIKVNTKHGMSRTIEYITWDSMLQRCNNPKTIGYKNYGFRGITICDKWLNFDGFFEDMGFKPKGLTLERRNNDLGYCKENCYYATPTEQARNQRVQKRNKTGIPGVCWDKVNRNYRVKIRIENKKMLHIGQFVNLEEAAEARKLAEQKYWGKVYSKEL